MADSKHSTHSMHSRRDTGFGRVKKRGGSGYRKKKVRAPRRCNRYKACCNIALNLTWEEACAQKITQSCKVDYGTHEAWLRAHTPDPESKVCDVKGCSNTRCPHVHRIHCAKCKSVQDHMRTTRCAQLHGALNNGDLCATHKKGDCAMHCMNCETVVQTLSETLRCSALRELMCPEHGTNYIVYSHCTDAERSCVKLFPPGANQQACLCGYSTKGAPIAHCVHYDEDTKTYCQNSQLIRLGEEELKRVRVAKEFVPTTKPTAQLTEVKEEEESVVEATEAVEHMTCTAPSLMPSLMPPLMPAVVYWSICPCGRSEYLENMVLCTDNQWYCQWCVARAV